MTRVRWHEWAAVAFLLIIAAFSFGLYLGERTGLKGGADRHAREVAELRGEIESYRQLINALGIGPELRSPDTKKEVSFER